jgi:hypothetical protein
MSCDEVFLRKGQLKWDLSEVRTIAGTKIYSSLCTSAERERHDVRHFCWVLRSSLKRRQGRGLKRVESLGTRGTSWKGPLPLLICRVQLKATMPSGPKKRLRAKRKKQGSPATDANSDRESEGISITGTGDVDDLESGADTPGSKASSRPPFLDREAVSSQTDEWVRVSDFDVGTPTSQVEENDPSGAEYADTGSTKRSLEKLAEWETVTEEQIPTRQDSSIQSLEEEPSECEAASAHSSESFTNLPSPHPEVKDKEEEKFASSTLDDTPAANKKEVASTSADAEESSKRDVADSKVATFGEKEPIHSKDSVAESVSSKGALTSGISQPRSLSEERHLSVSTSAVKNGTEKPQKEAKSSSGCCGVLDWLLGRDS